MKMETIPVIEEPSASYDPYALLGEFRTDLWLPHYPALEHAPWAIRQIMMIGARGYWGEAYKILGTVILVGPGSGGRVAWMSMTPSEIESQVIGLQQAHGHTVVVGLGMGWLAANAALRTEVEHVTVVERNPSVIALIEATGIFQQLPQEARQKLEIVQEDALSWRPSTTVDTIQADIWERFVEDQKLDDIRRMQDNIGAKAIYFWGQEMEIWRFANRRAGTNPTLDWPLLREIVESDIRLPLILPEWPDYPQKIISAAPWWTPRDQDWWR
jgi:hypothetical protein